MNDSGNGFQNRSSTETAGRVGGSGVVAAVLAAMLVMLMTCGCQESAKQPAVKTSKPLTELPKYSTSNYMNEAIRLIASGLNDQNSHVRTKAIEVVIDTRHVGFMPKIQQLLTDRYVPVRFLATLAVGDLGYEPAMPQIKERLKDPDPNVKIAAAYAMARLGHKEYERILRLALPTTDQELRANAVLMLGKNGNREDISLIRGVLVDAQSSDKVTLQCIQSLAMLGDESIYAKLWTRLISKYGDDRLIGVQCMGALGTPRARDALILQLEDEDNFLEVKLASAEQLGKLGSPLGEPEVLAVFEKNMTAMMGDEEARRVKVLAASAIGEIGTDNLTKYLPGLLKDRSVFVRLAAAKAVFRAAMKAPAS